MSGYRIEDAKTGRILDNRDVIATPFLISEGSRKPLPAIKRDGVWLCTSYPGFELREGETPLLVRVTGGY